MLASAVVLVFLSFLLRVVTVYVASIVIELEPGAKLLFGVPDSIPAEDRRRPFGNVTFFHFTVVVYGAGGG